MTDPDLSALLDQLRRKAYYAPGGVTLVVAFRAVEAALRAWRGPQPWQPITTAPKDQDILLCGPESVDIGNWQDEIPDTKESGVIVDPGTDAGWYGCRGMWPDGEVPTHWMPLYVPSWCYPSGPRMCSCGHHEGYHADSGACLLAHQCRCAGLPAECLTPMEDM